MKKNISKFTGYFQIEKLRNDKRIIVFTVCLFIATILWFLNALSKDYTTTISYPVKYINAPRNQFLSNSPVNKFELQVKAHGFTLLRHKLSLSFSPIVLNLTNITKNTTPNNGVYSLQTSSFRQRITEQVSKEIEITNIRPEIIALVLDSLKSKTVPVKLNASFNFKPQFNLKEPVSILPSKIKITGPAILLDTILFLRTEFKTFDKLDSDIEKTVALIHPENTSIQPEKIKIKIPVEKYTEKEIHVPVFIKNKPEGIKIKLFPSEIKVSILVGLSEFEHISAKDFKIYVDYNVITNSTENLEISIDSKPSFIEVLRFSPENIEFLIETSE